MELEAKHLVPYLPYALKLQYIVKDKVEKTGYMRSISHNEDETHPTRVSIDYNQEEHIWMFKPILRPLYEFGDSDDLRKVHEFIGLGGWCEAYDQYFDAWFNDACTVDKLVLQCPYKILEYFFSNHYDIFSLIEKGIAVDVNTLSVE